MINAAALSETEQKDAAEKTLVFRRHNEIFRLSPKPEVLYIERA